MKVRAILFDMDGVLIDSEALMARAGILALREFGIEAVSEDFLPFVGRGEDKYIGGVAEKHGVRYDTAMKDRAYDYYGQMVAAEATVPADTLPTLKALHARGIKMAVCSSADRVKVRYNLRAIGADESLFGAIVTGSDVERKKPEPDIYLKGAELLGEKPEDCLVVEDAPSGIQAAHAGGIRAAGIASSFSAQELTRQASPEYLIDRLSQLLELL
ncbi:MAG: HAD family hydrolase [Oscillospiraceae bacterium]